MKVVLDLFIEKEEKSELYWGSVKYEDNLMIDCATTTEELDTKMKVLLWELHNLTSSSIEFKPQFTN